MTDARIYEDLKPGVKALIMPWSLMVKEYHNTVCTVLSVPQNLRAWVPSGVLTILACYVRLHDGKETVNIYGQIVSICIHANALMPLPKDGQFEKEDGYEDPIPREVRKTHRETVKVRI